MIYGIDYIEWLIIPTLILVALWVKNLLNMHNAVINHSVVHMPYDNGSKWPSPRIDTALIHAKFDYVEYDSLKRRYTARNTGKKVWSEEIEVALIEYQGDYQVKCTSRCTFTTQITDWGKNKRNLQRFVSAYDECKNIEM